jgi:hypothetical protein
VALNLVVASGEVANLALRYDAESRPELRFTLVRKEHVAYGHSWPLYLPWPKSWTRACTSPWSMPNCATGNATARPACNRGWKFSYGRSNGSRRWHPTRRPTVPRVILQLKATSLLEVLAKSCHRTRGGPATRSGNLRRRNRRIRSDPWPSRVYDMKACWECSGGNALVALTILAQWQSAEAVARAQSWAEAMRRVHRRIQ